MLRILVLLFLVNIFGFSSQAQESTEFDQESFEKMTDFEIFQIAASYGGRNCTNNGDQLFCMVCNTYFESGFEPQIGKIQVGRTVMERIKIGRWGRSACSVIWANKQFSWTWINKSKVLPRSGKALEESMAAAIQAQSEGPNGASHYYNPRLANPGWAKNCRRAAIYQKYSQRQIGQHLFLTCPMYFNQLFASAPGYLDQKDLGPEQFMTSGSFMQFDENGEPVLGPNGEFQYRIPRSPSR